MSLCLSFFPPRCMYSSFMLCTTRITSVFSKRTLSPCLLKYLFTLSSVLRELLPPSAATVSPYACNSFRSTSFVQIFLLISSTKAINNNGIKALHYVRPTFTLESPYTPGPHSTLLFVSTTILSQPLGPPSTSGSHRHCSWDCSTGLLQVYESNCHILLSFQFLLY
ncbi:hypothetical protein NP493_1744g00039 [Ridgeia piscesae]|uniref:Uncharacterized protein n=1 Tax=Ridgeia piscesae TaxID=27915 RepID=A0AAD9N8B6_RIDPI|nr:hypothetical protein NP493_1744g00039 [Ridgeia piscesae]